MTKKEILKAKTFEEAQAVLATAKAEKKEALASLRSYCAENKLKQKVEPTEAKHQKKWKSLTEAYEKAKEMVEAAETHAKELKPSGNRKTKYEYPDGVTTAEEKKKYRAKLRADAKKAEKAANKAASKKEKVKSSKKKSAPADDSEEEDD